MTSVHAHSFSDLDYVAGGFIKQNPIVRKSQAGLQMSEAAKRKRRVTSRVQNAIYYKNNKTALNELSSPIKKQKKEAIAV